MREATAAHLITQHPGTPWDEPIPTFSAEYYDQPYLGPSKTKSLSGKDSPLTERGFVPASRSPSQSPWLVQGIVRLPATYGGCLYFSESPRLARGMVRFFATGRT